ncbi:DUF2535 family protein [Metabacillus iocasae]|uniref:DUF2535 family protein n=1 Tax=Priestia iocasae TaxID=2291674 RepID=UPI0019669453|nr:DUF2535 family protein [Metabacillus iocasae]
MLLKSLEFKHGNGEKVKIIQIPVLEEDSTFRFMISLRFEVFLNKIYHEPEPKHVYSFKDYLKRVLKWKDYEAIFKEDALKHNA